MNADYDLQQRIKQLEAQLLKAHKRLEAQQRRNTKQRQRLAQKYGRELLALIDGDPKVEVDVTELFEKIVFKDEQGHVISESDEIPVGKLLELKWAGSSLELNSDY